MWRFPTVHGIIRDVITVLSVGGSIIAPDRPDPEFLRAFRAAIGDYLAAHADDRLVFVIGGGAPARIYQQALRSASRDASASLLDWIGIRATHLNAMLVQAVFTPLSSPGIVTDPTGRRLEARLLHRYRCRLPCPQIRREEGGEPLQHKEGLYR